MFEKEFRRRLIKQARKEVINGQEKGGRNQRENLLILAYLKEKDYRKIEPIVNEDKGGGLKNLLGTLCSFMYRKIIALSIQVSCYPLWGPDVENKDFRNALLFDIKKWLWANSAIIKKQ